MIFKEDRGRIIIVSYDNVLNDSLEHTWVSYLCKTTKRMRAEQVSIRKKQQNDGIG